MALGLALALAGPLGPTPSALAAGRGVRLRYDVYYLALRVLSIESTALLDGAAYRVESRARTVGLLGALFPWDARSAARGALAAGRPVPAEYRSRSTYRGSPITVDLDYVAAGAARERVVGVPMEDRAPVAEADRRDTLDPLSATIALANEVADAGDCGGTQRVFDGVRRYDMDLRDLGASPVEPNGRSPFHGEARLCRAAVRPIGGFPHGLPEGGDMPVEASFWMRPPRDGEAAVPVRVDVVGSRGILHAYLVDAEPVDGDGDGASGAVGPVSGG